MSKDPEFGCDNRYSPFEERDVLKSRKKISEEIKQKARQLQKKFRYGK